MKKTNKRLKDMLIYNGERYAIMTADTSELWPHNEVKDVECEIEDVVPVTVFVNIRAVRIEKRRRIILPRFNK